MSKFFLGTLAWMVAGCGSGGAGTTINNTYNNGGSASCAPADADTFGGLGGHWDLKYGAYYYNQFTGTAETAGNTFRMVAAGAGSLLELKGSYSAGDDRWTGTATQKGAGGLVSQQATWSATRVSRDSGLGVLAGNWIASVDTADGNQTYQIYFSADSFSVTKGSGGPGDFAMSGIVSGNSVVASDTGGGSLTATRTCP